jgi:hypothetical protein
MPGVHGPKAGGRSVHDYSKLFNHLAQYALAQVDTDDKKKDRFMIVSNVIIMDHAIRAHKDAKKRKAIAAPSDSAPPRYRMVYHHGPTYPPHQQQHQRQ